MNLAASNLEALSSCLEKLNSGVTSNSSCFQFSDGGNGDGGSEGHLATVCRQQVAVPAPVGTSFPAVLPAGLEMGLQLCG